MNMWKAVRLTWIRHKIEFASLRLCPIRVKKEREAKNRGERI